MPRVVIDKTNFAAGQIDEAARVDRSKTLYEGGCAQLKNYRILNGRGTKRRPGMRRRAAISNGKSIGVGYVTEAGNEFKLIFSNARLDVIDSANAVAQSLTSQPWLTATLDEIYIEASQAGVIVCHHDFWPQLIEVDSAGTWSIADFVFASAPGGGTAQPYWNFQAKGVTLTPSALTGSITLTSSAGHFVAGHVGVIVRYVDREVEITGFTNATTVTGTVVDALPQTVTVVVADGTGFLVDEVVSGLDSGADGVITNVSTNTLTVLMRDGLTGFTNGELLVGDGGSQSVINTGPTNTTPAAALQWDEQVISAVRGYPGGCAHHRARLYFFDFRDLPRGISASASFFPDDHSVGADDGDGFFELVPEYKGQRVRHVVSEEQGVVLTDRMAYYLPEYANQIITPETIDFKEIGPVGASIKKPTKTERGIMYEEEGSNRIIGILSTDSVQGPWELVDVSAFWTELMTGPRSLASDEGNTGWPERYSFVVNDDGSMAVVRFEPDGSDVPLGWVPWTTQGSFRSIFTVGGSLYAIVERSINAVTTWLLEEFDDTIWLDCAVDYSGAADTLTEFASDSVYVMLDHKSLGEFDVNGSGILTTFAEVDDTYLAGFDFTTNLDLLAPDIQHPAYVHGKRHSIPKLQVHVHDTSSYLVNGVLVPAYRSGEDLDALPPLRTEAKQGSIAGRSATLAPQVTQDVPSPAQFLGFTMEVSF